MRAGPALIYESTAGDNAVAPWTGLVRRSGTPAVGCLSAPFTPTAGNPFPSAWGGRKAPAVRRPFPQMDSSPSSLPAVMARVPLDGVRNHEVV
jgi:hypothetical protein